MNRRRNRALALSLMLCLFAAGRLAAQATAVGQLLGVQGRVERKTPRQQPKKVQSFDQVKEGDLLTLRDKSAVTLVLYKSGARYALAAGSAIKIVRAQIQSLSGPSPRSLPSVSKRLLKKISAPMTGFGPKSAGVMIRVMQEQDAGPRYPSPVGAVRTAEVTLRWEGSIGQADGTGKAGQRVEIKEDETGEIVFTKDMELTARECTVEQGKLEPGRWYLWTITAAGKGIGLKRCSASLYVLPTEEAAEVAAIEKEIGISEANDTTLKLLMAQGYERFGLLADALTAYESASRLAPSDAEVQKSLIRLRKQTGHEE